MTDQEQQIYRNPFGKERIIRDPEFALNESQKRREYFNSIEAVVVHDFAEYMAPVQEMSIVGSVAENAAEVYSDIDVLLHFVSKLTPPEIKYLSNIARIYIEEINASEPYQISLYYKRQTPLYPALTRLSLKTVVNPDIEPLGTNSQAL